MGYGLCAGVPRCLLTRIAAHSQLDPPLPGPAFETATQQLTASAETTVKPARQTSCRLALDSLGFLRLGMRSQDTL
eukprot:3492510-Rhodomonas_salina.2